jgi:hypothetical protein
MIDVKMTRLKQLIGYLVENTHDLRFEGNNAILRDRLEPVLTWKENAYINYSSFCLHEKFKVT